MEIEKAYSIRKEIAGLERQIMEIRARAEAVTPTLTGLPKGNNTTDKVGNGAVQLVLLEGKLKERAEELGEELIKLEGYIAMIPDPVIREIARERFLLGHTWEKVAMNVGYATKDSVCRAWRNYCESVHPSTRNM